jgi:hypothetical protein
VPIKVDRKDRGLVAASQTIAGDEKPARVLWTRGLRSIAFHCPLSKTSTPRIAIGHWKPLAGLC